MRRIPLLIARVTKAFSPPFPHMGRRYPMNRHSRGNFFDKRVQILVTKITGLAIGCLFAID